MQLYDQNLKKILGHVPTLFLFQLAYWSKKCGRKEEGKTWVYNTQEEWADQLGITRKTLWAATDKLRRLGLVSVSYRAKNRYNRTLSYSLEVEAISLNSVQSIVQSLPTPLSKNYSMDCVISTQCNSNKNNPRKSTSTEVVAGSNKSKNPEVFTGGAGREGENEKISSLVGGLKVSHLTNGDSFVKGKSIAEIAEGLKQSKGSEIKGTPYSLMTKWNATIGEMTGVFQTSPTQKEVGQMKLIWKKVPDAAALVEKVLADWNGFTKAVRIATGTSASPSNPHVGYLLTHLQVAVNWTTIVKPYEKLLSGIGEVKFITPKVPEKNFSADAWNKQKPKQSGGN